MFYDVFNKFFFHCLLKKFMALNPHKNQQICICTTPTKEKLLILPQDEEIDTTKHPECVCIHTSDMSHNTFSTPPPVQASPTTPTTPTSPTSSMMLRPSLFYKVNMIWLLLGIFLIPLVLACIIAMVSK